MAHVTRLAARRDPMRSGARFGPRAERSVSHGYQEYRPARGWNPPANFCEYEDHYCLILELAGMSAEEIDLRIEPARSHRRGRTAGTLIVGGERRAPQSASSSDITCLHLMEIDHGPFMRALELPPDVDIDGVEATYRGGYLCIRIPRRQR